MNWQDVEAKIALRMKSEAIAQEVIDDFLSKVRAVYDGETGKIPWSEISELHSSDTVRLDTLEAANAPPSDLVMIRLNGGLGTSMGLSRAKSVIPVKDGQNFIQIMLKQLRILRRRYNLEIPLLFMNSYNTHEDMMAEPGIEGLNDRIERGFPVDFLQNRVPRIAADSLMPVGDGRSKADWCPPGHGDLYLSLKLSGILDALLNRGFRTAFIANGDNLGAMFDPRLHARFVKSGLDFAMEVTPKSKADLKGGILVRRNGHIILLEIAQVSSDHIPDFEDSTRFAHFNTNNLWVNLESLRDRLHGGLSLSLIVNPKKVDGRDVLQLETAMGSAIGRFDRAEGFVVPRERFAPVKNCSDLLLRRSDAYILTEDYSLVLNPSRNAPEPSVDLDGAYKSIQDFDRLFLIVPSLVSARSLRVEGEIEFDSPVFIRGEVSFVNRSGAPRKISEAKRMRFEDEVYEFV